MLNSDYSPGDSEASSTSAPASSASTARITALLAGQYAHLSDHVRSRHPEADPADLDSAVEAGTLAGARTAHSNADGVGAPREAHTTAMTTAAAAAAVQDQAQPVATPGDYSRLGGVIPVLPGSPGAGASTVAAVLADALQVLSWRVLLADTADVARSGLASAARWEGPVVPGPHEAVRIRFSWRGQALVARPESSLPVLSPGMVPPPAFWVPPMGSPQFTVVDLSYDAWRLAAQPFSGPGAWLRSGHPSPRPLLVVRPSRPSLAQAEQALARLETWTGIGAAVVPAALVVLGAKRWPDGVAGAAGQRVSALLDRAVFLPHVPETATGGIGPDIAPLRLREAITPLLRAWHLAPTHSSRGATTRLFGKGGFR